MRLQLQNLANGQAMHVMMMVKHSVAYQSDTAEPCISMKLKVTVQRARWNCVLPVAPATRLTFYGMS